MSTESVSKILFSPQEDKIHIFTPPCNILYMYSMDILQNTRNISKTCHLQPVYFIQEEQGGPPPEDSR